MTDIERAALFLKGANEVQVRHVACNLAALFRDHGRAVHDQLGVGGVLLHVGYMLLHSRGCQMLVTCWLRGTYWLSSSGVLLPCGLLGSGGCTLECHSICYTVITCACVTLGCHQLKRVLTAK
jgi:hypothetical protein